MSGIRRLLYRCALMERAHHQTTPCLRRMLWNRPETLDTGMSLHRISSPVREFSTESTNTTMASLRNMVKPFFLKCHPDVHPSPEAKTLNLQALQNINGFLDAMEATSEGRVVEWPSSVDVEFLIPILERPTKTKHMLTPRSTMVRRRIELVVPSPFLREAVVKSMGDSKRKASRKLFGQVQRELAKVLTVAGLPIPSNMSSFEENEPDDWREAAWEDELGIGDQGQPGSRGRRFATPPQRPKTEYEKSRDRFVNNIDWKKLNQIYEEAVRDMQADIATEGKVEQNTKRRQDAVNKIVSRVRIAKDADLTMVDQLIGLRRLALILADNYEELYMEEMGRMWENLVIVFTGERPYNTSRFALLKRKKRLQDNGFQFACSADERVTIHVPIDFQDDELVRELHTNLWTFFNLLGDELDNMFPQSL